MVVGSLPQGIEVEDLTGLQYLYVKLLVVQPGLRYPQLLRNSSPGSGLTSRYGFIRSVVVGL